MTVQFPKPYADLVARLRVPFGFILVASFAWFSHPDVLSLTLGMPVSLIGLLIRAWAAGNLAKNQTLASNGPYAYTRNPLYLGTLLVAAGLAIASRSIGLGILFALVFIGIYLPVIQLEQQHLRSLFPEYNSYAAQVPVLLPRLTPAGNPGCFQWALYLKNQEYQALLGFAVGLAWLVWKAVVR